MHEYQAKNQLLRFKIAVPPYAVISHMDEVPKAIDALGLTSAIIKIQIHAGGRGKMGGVQLAKNREEILRHCQALLGKTFINAQTGPQGLKAHTLLLTPPIAIKKEYYLAALFDQSKKQSIILASPDGGVDIESVAEKNPDRVIREPISLEGNLRDFQLRALGKKMGWDKALQKMGLPIISRLAKLFTACDALLFEINPLVETQEGELLALDAKANLDENALFRHPDLAACYDPSQYTPNEARARAFDLSYIGLEGTIGCLVNGAGLAMATMDIIQHYGGAPANFLDIGGSATEEKIRQGFSLLLEAENVTAILVNIFGGIMDCRKVARGIVQALQETRAKKPLVVRLEGTEVEEGKSILQNFSNEIFFAHSIKEGAKKVVELSNGHSP